MRFAVAVAVYSPHPITSALELIIKKMFLCTGDPYYVLYTALLIS
jgi:hypothetical protein